MEVACPVIIVIIVILFVVSSRSGVGQLMKKGVPARGILLQVSSFATRVPNSNPRAERRQVTIDVEVPGQAPYVVSTMAVVLSTLRNDVMPGATVELRVDPKNKKNLAIVGPGSGFAVTGLVTQPQGNPTS
jgi:hypothetical protein